MRKLLQNKNFVIGFSGGLFLFFCLNVLAAYPMNPQPCHHCAIKLGFPFGFYEYSAFFGPPYEEGRFLSFGLLADALIAIIFSFVCGMLFSYERNRIE